MVHTDPAHCIRHTMKALHSVHRTNNRLVKHLVRSAIKCAFPKHIFSLSFAPPLSLSLCLSLFISLCLSDSIWISIMARAINWLQQAASNEHISGFMANHDDSSVETQLTFA